MQVLGIFIGASFAELTVLDGQSGESVYFHRWYLPRLGIRNQLQKIFQAHPQLQPKSALICSRFIEKIFDYRLGGSVAQLVTSGFEHWPYLSQIATHQNIFKAQRSQPISSPELTFAVNERIDQNGQITQNLALEDLQAIHEKLKLMDVKKICIHYLHAHKNPLHLEQTEQFFLEHGYEIFIPPKVSSADETALWRQNTLNAATTGTFGELRRELEEGLTGLMSPEDIRFINSQNEIFTNENQHRLSSLFGMEALWSEQIQNADIVDLGLEKFTYSKPDVKNQIWQSPWGPVYHPHPALKDLTIQPSSAIEINEWDELGFSQKPEGFEPGPMLFGRGQKPLFFDLFNDEIANHCPEIRDNIHTQGQARVLSSIQALSRLTKQNKTFSPTEEIQNLKEKALDILVQEIHFQSSGKPLLINGFFGAIFFNELKKRAPHLKLSLLHAQSPLKSQQIAHKALTLQKNGTSI